MLDHSGVGEEKIPVIGMSFGSLPLTQKFYANYAKKVGFVTKIRNTNFDKTWKESKIPVNQSIYCMREGYRESRVNAATRANRITATRCRARMYVMLDKEKESWVVSRLEWRHSHPCSAKKAVHYHEYRELTMHAKCVITNNDEAGIRPNKTYLALANEVGRHSLPFAFFVGVNHHGKSTLLGCALLGSEEIPSFEWVFMQWVLPDTVHRWCIWHIMKKSQFKLGGYARYGELNAMMKHIVWNSPLTESFKVDLAGFIKQFNLGQNRWLADLYANRRKWVPIFFKSEFWAGMRSTQHSESMHVFYGGYLHCKSGLVQFIHEYDNVLGNNEQKELEDDAADSKGVIPCIGSTGIERQFQQEYTSSMFRTLQLEIRKKLIARFDQLNKREIQFLLKWTSRSKNVIRKHTYIKSSHDMPRSDERNNLFRHLCSEFYNVAQELVVCDEEAGILQAALWDAKSKLTDYRASMPSTTVVATQNTMPTHSTGGAIVHDIQGPSRVKTKGRPRSKRLGAELDKSIKKSMQKRKRKSHLICVRSDVYFKFFLRNGVLD
ncbi:hypothetical protein Ahy_B10g105026 [Arachis hypogaea]|uniref:FAR1 domain-containing protein n=1 Tax=Arachis hypogaea TaxID=3818 RepID=A0A444X717_ARAHY|nr:hypothetical protein Ahy_B10g105026 [Arachis hypogaea]